MELKKKAMKILHIDSGLFWRGGQRQVLTLHQKLLDSGVNSYLACNGSGELFKKAKKMRIANLFPYEYKSEISLSTFKSLKKIRTKIAPDIIHCHDGHSITYGVLLKKKSYLFETRRVSYKINKFSRVFKYSKVDAHISVSNDIKMYLKKYFDQVFTIHSCIDLSRFKQKAAKDKFDQSKINLLFVGALSKQKGLEILLQAFSKLSKLYKNLHLNIVGSGELQSWLEEKILELNISNGVTLFGHHSDIENFYHSSDIVIFPSVDGEGSSGVIKESMAANKIIIASDLACNKEIIADGLDGILFSNNSAESLLEKIEKVLINPNFLNITDIKKKVREFSCETIAAKYIQIYCKYHNK